MQSHMVKLCGFVFFLGLFSFVLPEILYFYDEFLKILLVFVCVLWYYNRKKKKEFGYEKSYLHNFVSVVHCLYCVFGCQYCG